MPCSDAASTYQIFKDFAGPGATIIASIAAAWITWRIGSQQMRVAKQQAGTTLDQLRHNLFDKRHGIFKDVQNFVKFLANSPDDKIFKPEELIPNFIIMDEARFFFSDDVCSWLDGLKSHCQSFVKAHASREAKEINAKLKDLVDYSTLMSKRFEKELEFHQLTRRAPDAP